MKNGKAKDLILKNKFNYPDELKLGTLILLINGNLPRDVNNLMNLTKLFFGWRKSKLSKVYDKLMAAGILREGEPPPDEFKDPDRK